MADDPDERTPVDAPEAENAPVPRHFRALRFALGGAGHLVRATAVVVVFVATFLVGFVVHFDRPVARRLVARVTTAALAPLFRGKIVADRIDHIGLEGVDVGAAHVEDTHGKVVVSAEGIHVRTPLMRVARRVVTAVIEHDDIVIRRDEVEVEGGSASLDAGDVTIALAEAFEQPPKPTTAPVSTGPRTAVTVELPHVHVRRGAISGQPSPGVEVDASGSRIAASLVAGTEGVVLDVERSTVATSSFSPYDAKGTAEYHLRLSPGASLNMWAGFNGSVGGVEVSASWRMDDGRMRGTVDAPRVLPDDLRPLAPNVPAFRPASAHVEVDGKLPDLAFTGRLLEASGPGELDVDGLLHLADPFKIETDFTAKDIDPHDIDEAAPTTRAGAIGHVTLVFEDGKPLVNASVSTTPAMLGTTYIPPLTGFAKLENGVITGSADVHEPDAQAHATFKIDDRGVIDVDTTASADKIGQLPQIAGLAEGAAKVTAHAHLEAGKLDVDASASLRGAGKGTTKVDGADVRAHITGPLAALRLSAIADARGIHVGDSTFARAHVTADGPLAGPHRVVAKVIDPRWDDLSATASLDLRKGADVRDASVTFRQGDVVADAKVARVTDIDGAIRAEGVRVGGSLGTAQGGATIENGALRVDLEGTIDLRAINRVMPSIPLTSGQGKYAVHVRESAGSHDGTATLSLAKLELSRAPFDGAADLAVDLSGKHAHATLSGSVVGPSGKALVRLASNADADLNGSLAAPKTWETANFGAKIDNVAIDLDALFAEPIVRAVLDDKARIEKLSGTVALTGTVSRPGTSGLPAIDLAIATHDVVVAEHGESFGGRRTDGRSLEGVDAEVDLGLAPSPSTDKKAASQTRLRVAAKVTDKVGQIAYADVATTSDPFDLAKMLTDLAEDGNVQAAALTRLQALPLAGRFSWAERPLEALPLVIRPKGFTGTVAASLDASGTIGQPHAQIALRGTNVVAKTDGVDPWPIDFAMQGQVADKRVETWVRVVHGPSEVVNVDAYADVDVARAIWDLEGDPTWSAGGLIELRGVQLEALPQVAAAGLRGRASGTLSIAGVHQHPTAQLDVSILKGSILGGAFPIARVQGRIAEGASVLTASVRQAGTRTNPDGGSLDLTALASVRFPNGFLPLLDPAEPQTIALRLGRFDLGPFGSLAEPAIEGLGGELTGELSLAVIGDKIQNRPSLQDLNGKLLWSSGELLIPQIGQTFTNGRLTLDAHHEGDAVLFTINDVALDATTGHARGSATAVLPTEVVTLALFGDESGALADRSLFAIRAALRISKAEKIPLTFEGVSLGDAYGNVDVDLDLRKSAVDVSVAVPELHFELPDTATRQVQDLADNPEVGVVDRRYVHRRAAAKAAATKIIVKLGLGSSLDELLAGKAASGRVGITRPGLLEVYVRGNPVVTIDDAVHMTGTIEAAGGQVTALGKQFVVEPGNIRFDDDPTNPALNLSARWDTSAGVRVYADVTGTAESYKLHFRSEPSRPESDVVSLILFGRERTQQPGDTADQSGAGALGGGVASTVLNQLINPVQIFGRRLETRVDTSSSTNTKVGIATEIRPNLWAQVDVSTANQQQRQNQDVSTVTLDWRFRTNWSLRTTVGDRGSSIIDLLWQYRY